MWSCSGDPNGAEPVRVVMTKDADKFDVTPSSDIYIGKTFEIRMKEDGREFPSEIKFDIRNGQTLQSLSFHTSCSQPLSVGDQFGKEKFLCDLCVSSEAGGESNLKQ